MPDVNRKYRGKKYHCLAPATSATASLPLGTRKTLCGQLLTTANEGPCIVYDYLDMFIKHMNDITSVSIRDGWISLPSCKHCKNHSIVGMALLKELNKG